MSVDLLNTMVTETEAQIKDAGSTLDTADLEMIVSQFIKAIRVGRDYNIEVDFNVSFDEFQSYCGVKAKENVEDEDTAIVRTA